MTKIPAPPTGPRLVEFNPDALYVAIDRERRRRRVRSQREVLRQAGINAPAALTRLGQGKSLDANTLAALLYWLGTTDMAPYIRAKVAP